MRTAIPSAAAKGLLYALHSRRLTPWSASVAVPSFATGARCCSSSSSTTTGNGNISTGRLLRLPEDETLIPHGGVGEGRTSAISSSASTPDPVNSAASHAHLSSSSPSPSSALPTEGYAPWEVRALVLALIPPANAGLQPIAAKHVLYQLPAALQQQLQRHKGGLADYCETHFAEDVELVKQHAGVGLQRRSHGSSVASLNDTAASVVATPSKTGRPRGATAAIVDTAPPPPPTPSSASRTRGGSQPRDTTFHPGKNYTTIEIVDALVEYIPTFFVTADAVAATVPSDVQQLYADTSFSFFLKRFKHYIDIRTNHGHSEVRLRPDFDHPKRGLADEHHGGTVAGRFMASPRGAAAAGTVNGRSSFPPLSSSSSPTSSSSIARPPRNSEANLIQYIVPRMPKTYTPLSTVLQDISDLVSRHPSFDPRLGVTGLLEKYPEYFQLVDGQLRARPHKSAPNSLDDSDLASSPLPVVFGKVQTMVTQAAEGKNFLEEADKAAASVPTGKLYAQLTAAEKKQVKEECRSFPRFLRLHGKTIVVSGDSMRVRLFKPEYERCAETILGSHLAANAISPDDPILQIPAEMDDNTHADWAVKELYDSLPLTQCAELEDVLSLVPPAVRDALPAELPEIVSEVLDRYPDYFLCWRYPDDERVIIVQRAKVAIPDLDTKTIVRMAFPLIPQGGIALESLRRRVPLPLQRYFHRFGMRKVLGSLPQHFRIAGDRVIRIG